MVNAVLTGLGQTDPVRRSGRHAAELALEAIRAAIADAGLVPSDIGGIVTESSIVPKLAPAHEIIPAAGLTNVSLSATSTPTGAGILHAVGLAAAMVEAGRADHVLTYFAVDWGTHREGPNEYHGAMDAKSVIERPAGFAGPPLYFAMAARRYAYEYGLSEEELTGMMSEVVLASRANARLHPGAQLRHDVDRAKYLASPLIASPLRRDDCCLLSDGAVAVVVSNPKASRVPAESRVTLAGWSWASESISDTSFYSQSMVPALGAATEAMRCALGKSGMGQADIDVAELYDCFSPATIFQLEALGFCKPGEAPGFVSGGALQSNGAHPVNTHGGLLAHGYLLGANHLAEAIIQLRHQGQERQVSDAEVAMVGAGPGRQYAALLLKKG